MKMFLAEGENVNEKGKVFWGYSGWGAGQLDKELERHDWAVLKDDNTASLVMSAGVDDIWNEAVARFGNQYRLWNTWPDDVSLN